MFHKIPLNSGLDEHILASREGLSSTLAVFNFTIISFFIFITALIPLQSIMYSKKVYMYSKITSRKSPSFCITNYSASLTNLTAT